MITVWMKSVEDKSSLTFTDYWPTDTCLRNPCSELGKETFSWEGIPLLGSFRFLGEIRSKMESEEVGLESRGNTRSWKRKINMPDQSDMKKKKNILFQLWNIKNRCGATLRWMGFFGWAYIAFYIWIKVTKPIIAFFEKVKSIFQIAWLELCGHQKL